MEIMRLLSGRYFYLSAWKSRFRVAIFIYRPGNLVFGSLFYFICLKISFSGRYFILSAWKSRFRVVIYSLDIYFVDFALPTLLKFLYSILLIALFETPVHISASFTENGAPFNKYSSSND